MSWTVPRFTAFFEKRRVGECIVEVSVGIGIEVCEVHGFLKLHGFRPFIFFFHTYIGYKGQLEFNELAVSEQSRIREWAYDLLMTLYENELEYTHDLYDEIGWTDEVITFLEYNANKALMNLGFDPLFPTDASDVNPIIMNGISTGTSNHDFFSQVGNGYLLGQVEPTEDDDYLMGLD